MLQESEIQRIYSEIGKYSIELSEDPTTMGPRYVSKQLALCRNYLNRVTQIRVDLSKHKRTLGVKIAGENTQLQVERDQLLSTNDLVRKQSNIKDREAVANTMLRERLARIEVLNQDLLDLKMVDAAVEFVHNELIRTSNEIKTQKALLEIDRHYKLGYGDETEGDTTANRDAKGRPLPADDDGIENEVLAALASIEAQKVSDTTPSSQEGEAELLLAAPEVVSETLDTPSFEAQPVPQVEPKACVDEPLADLDLNAFVAGVDPLPTAEIKTQPEPVKKKKKTTPVAAPEVSTASIEPEFDFQELLAGL